MNSQGHDDTEWYEGYLNNVWCKYKLFTSLVGDLFVVAKKDSTIRLFALRKQVLDENKGRELNNVIEKSEELSELPKD